MLPFLYPKPSSRKVKKLSDISLSLSKTYELILFGKTQPVPPIPQ